MASTSFPTDFAPNAGNSEGNSADGPVYATFVCNTKQAPMTEWSPILNFVTDSAVLEQVSSMMGCSPSEIEFRMQQELHSFCGAGNSSSPASNFSPGATDFPSQIPTDINEFGYSYGCERSTEYLLQFIDPSLIVNPGYGLQTGFSLASNDLPFSSPHASRVGATCIGGTPHQEDDFPIPFSFDDNLPFNPTTSAQQNSMVPSQTPEMDYGMPRPATPDAVVLGRMMTPTSSRKPSPVKEDGNHHSGAPAAPLSHEMSSPTKTRNLSPATPCRQTRAMTGKLSPPATPGSVALNGSDVSFEPAESTSVAAKGRKRNTPTRLKRFRRSTAADTLPEIAAVEIMGFDFGDVQRMQAESRLPHPVIYNSLEEAQHDRFEHLLEHEYDSTIPTTVLQKQVLVGHIMKAMKNVESTNEGRTAIRPWEKGVYPDELIEQGAWAQLVRNSSYFGLV